MTYLDGRKLRGRQEAPRWVDAYTVPGQFIRVRREAGAAAPRLYALANSPYAAKRESANLDASIVEARTPEQAVNSTCCHCTAAPRSCQAARWPASLRAVRPGQQTR